MRAHRTCNGGEKTLKDCMVNVGVGHLEECRQAKHPYSGVASALAADRVRKDEKKRPASRLKRQAGPHTTLDGSFHPVPDQPERHGIMIRKAMLDMLIMCNMALKICRVRRTW